MTDRHRIEQDLLELTARAMKGEDVSAELRHATAALASLEVAERQATIANVLQRTLQVAQILTTVLGR